MPSLRSVPSDAAPTPSRQELKGMLLGLGGVAIFSLSLPVTRIAVAEWSPVTVGLGRALVAAILAAVILFVTRQPVPARRDIGRLLVVALGVVFGFPLTSAVAMQYVPSAHGGVVLGVLPLATALAGVVVAGERPSLGFWLVGLLGSAAVVVFALIEGAGALHPADVLLFLSVVSAAVGYAVGGQLARRLGGWQVICWALVLSIPALLPPVLWALPETPLDVGWRIWAAFGYVALFSQFLGFFFWNRGLALGGVARVGQTQLLQPFLTILGAALLVGERIDTVTIAFAVLVVALVAAGRRMPIRRV